MSKKKNVSYISKKLLKKLNYFYLVPIWDDAINLIENVNQKIYFFEIWMLKTEKDFHENLI